MYAIDIETTTGLSTALRTNIVAIIKTTKHKQSKIESLFRTIADLPTIGKNLCLEIIV